MLSDNSILHSIQIENEHKKLRTCVDNIKSLCKTQYDLDWEDFGKVEAPEGMVVSGACCKDILDRLEIWCKIDRLADRIGDQVAQIRASEKKLAKRGGKADE